MMKTSTAIFLSAVLCCVLLSAGCGGGGRAKPKDMPPLYPVTLTFTQEGVPVDEASIVLNSSGKWAVAGMTDEKGEVNLVTNGFYDGAPEGSYKIAVTKIVYEKNSAGTIVKQTDVIPDQFKREATTPLEIEIGKKDNNKTFDLGKAVSINVPIED